MQSHHKFNEHKTVESVVNRIKAGETIALISDAGTPGISDIIQKLQEAKLIVVEGTLYPLLTRLKNSELLSYQWIESTQGPPRKYYQLTPKGEEFLGELETSWQELNDTINHIRNN